MLFCKEEFVTVSASYAELENMSVSDKFPASAQYAGVRQLLPEIVVSEICMSIEMDDVQIIKLFFY